MSDTLFENLVILKVNKPVYQKDLRIVYYKLKSTLNKLCLLE